MDASLRESCRRFHAASGAALAERYPGLTVRRMIDDLAHLLPRRRGGADGLARAYFGHLGTGAPLEHFTGTAFFYGRPFHVDGRVLVPRPETEGLVELALARAREGSVVVDVGTGSGNVVLTVALESGVPLRAFAFDTSPGALEAARWNHFLHSFGLPRGTSVRFAEGDRLGSFRGAADVVVSNPPYLKERADLDRVHPQVAAHEPREALFLPDEGYGAWYDAFFRQALRALAPGGVLLMEGHEDRLEGLAERARALGFGGADVLRDLAGRPRYLRAAPP